MMHLSCIYHAFIKHLPAADQLSTNNAATTGTS
ncbi:MAG: hypothetical protein ACI9SB_001815 [Candidatus Azotimanducaceae bacterium]